MSDAGAPPRTQAMTAERPLPRPDDMSEPFWAGCNRGVLVAQRCTACGRFRFPPRPTCPACRSFDHDWVELSGRGRVWSWIRAHPPLLPAFMALAPYVCVVVELEEDPVHLRMTGRLHPDCAEPKIGDAARVDFEPAGDQALPIWRLE